MGYGKKELKMYIKYLKRTIKMLSKMEYSWKWNPLAPLLQYTCFSTIKDLNEELKYYTMKLQDLKEEN